MASKDKDEVVLKIYCCWPVLSGFIQVAKLKTEEEILLTLADNIPAPDEPVVEKAFPRSAEAD